MRGNPKSHSENIIVQEMESELLIYDLKINKAFSLNETCAMVWRECDGKRNIAEITSILSLRTNGLVNGEVVWLALDSLQRENLLTDGIQIPANFDGLSRRQIIKKVGFASFVLLPHITSLISPTAANAASGVCSNLNQSCVALGDSSQSNCCSTLRCIFNSTCSPCAPTNTFLSSTGNIFSAAACTTLCQSTAQGGKFCCNTTSLVQGIYSSFANQCDCRCP